MELLYELKGGNKSSKNVREKGLSCAEKYAAVQWALWAGPVAISRASTGEQADRQEHSQTSTEKPWPFDNERVKHKHWRKEISWPIDWLID